ncbi:MAG: hypothetical protein H7Y28_04520 [Rhodoferax sp.]|nr:hypothetical protein [Rhodoferax sp.]
MNKLVVSIAIGLMLGGCATKLVNPTPESYNGPRAKIYDSMMNVDSSKGDFCVLETLNGDRIANSIGETLDRGRGRGLTLAPWITDRRIPSLPVKAGLRCETVHAAPILALVGKVRSVSGVVDFSPKDEGRYVVKGELKESGSSVWIEDKDSGEAVTAKVTSAK